MKINSKNTESRGTDKNGSWFTCPMVSFAITYQPGVSLQQIIGFELAAKIWSQYITDDVQFNLHVEETNEIPDNIIGGAVPIFDRVGYEQLKAALNNDQLTDSDRQAVENLTGVESSDLAYSTFIENTELTGDRVTLSTANAKALGLLDEDSAPSLDGYIVINDLKHNEYNWSYDFARTGETGTKSLDFLSVALHEIGHALGFISGIDSQEISDDESNLAEQLENLSTLDLFRYSDRSLAEDSLEFTKGESSFFSIDGGETKIAEFTSGVIENGKLVEGYQASHWNNISGANPTRQAEEPSTLVQSSTVDEDIASILEWAFPANPTDEVEDASQLLLNRSKSDLLQQAQISTVTGIGERGQLSIGVMDPTLAPGEQSEISELDLTALDVLGFDRTLSEVNLNYANLLAEVEESLAERLDLSVEELKKQDNLASFRLTENRYAEVASTIELNKILARRRRRVSTRYNSFWQENSDIDPTSLIIISDGAGEVSELNGSLDDDYVTRVEAIPHTALTFRSLDLQGDERDDLIVPRFDEYQDIDAGDGNNIVQLGIQGGNLSLGSGNDVVIVNGGQANILDQGGDNHFELRETSAEQTLMSGDGQDQILFVSAKADITSGAGDDIIIGDGFQNQETSDQWDVKSAAGDNRLVLGGQKYSTISATTGNGSDSIDIRGGYLSVDSGGGDDKIQANIGAKPSTAAHQHTFTTTQGNNEIHIQSQAKYDSALINTGDGADYIMANVHSAIVNSGDGNDIIQGDWTNAYSSFTVSTSGGDNQIQLEGQKRTNIDVTSGGGADEILVVGGDYSSFDIQADHGFNVVNANGGNYSNVDVTSDGGADEILVVGGDHSSFDIQAGHGFNVVNANGGNYSNVDVTSDGGADEILVVGGDHSSFDIQAGHGFNVVNANGGNYSNINIESGQGDDLINVEGQNVSTHQNISIQSGAGNDIIRGDGFRNYSNITVSSLQGDNQVHLNTTQQSKHSTLAITTGSGSDKVIAHGGSYSSISVISGDGDDIIQGFSTGHGRQTVSASGGNNHIDLTGGLYSSHKVITGDGADSINFVGDNASVRSGDGNDIIHGRSISSKDSYSNISISTESGDNQISFQGKARDNVSILTGNGQDQISVTHANYEINAGDGNDIINNTFGTGTFSGGIGNDVLISKGDKPVTLNGNEGQDILVGDFGKETLQGGAFMDTLIGGRNHDSLNGGDGDDILIGTSLSGNTEIEKDTLDGGGGNDIYVLGNKTSRFYNSQGGKDFAQINSMSRDDKIQLHGKASDYVINKNRILYNDDVIATFVRTVPLNLESDQFIYVGPESGELDRAEIDLSPFNLSFVDIAAPERKTPIRDIVVEDIADIREPITLASSGGSNTSLFATELATIESFKSSLKEALQNIDSREEISYSIIGGADEDLFNISSISGELTFKNDDASLAAIAADEDQRFEVQIQATQDNGNRARDTDTQTLRINLAGGVELPLNDSTQPDRIPEADPSLRKALPGQDSAINGTAQDDRLQGTQFDDLIYGDGGNDKLEGRSNADTLLGGLGNDTLSGGLGADWLEGTNGSNDSVKEVDRLFGGAGTDTFVLGDESGAFYINRNDGDRAVIEDFEVAKDILLLHGSASDYTVTEVGNNSRISYGEDLVAFVKNTVNLDVTQPNFQFLD